MKSIIILALMAITASVHGQATGSEEAMLRKTLMDYLEGGTEGDTVRLSRSFHPSAYMKYVDFKTGEFRDVPIAEYLQRAKANAGQKSDRKTRIVSINIFGDAAQAHLEIDYGTVRLQDLMNLLRINGEWKIVNKIFSRQEKL